VTKKLRTNLGALPTGFGRPRPMAVPAPAAPVPAALFAEGLKLHQAGRLADAEQIYRRVLAARPDHFDSLHLLGVIFFQRGQHARAVQQIDLALRRNPNHAAALNNRGNALTALKRFAEALASYDRAVVLQRDFAEAYSNRGNVLKELGRHEEALSSYDRALALRPDFAEAHSNRGDVLSKLNRFTEALASCDRALALRPDYAEALSNRGNALLKLKRFDEALANYDRALALQPDYSDAHSNRGNALRELSRFDEALASYDRAIDLQPGFAAAHCNRGSVLENLNRFDEAIGSYDRAIELQPDFATAYSNRGNALREIMRFDEALASFDRALAIEPDFADAHYNEAVCRLLLGDLERGWEKNEWRWKTEQLRDGEQTFAQPLWRGSDDIAGKSIFLHAEQGLGDTIQFGRYVPLVAARGAQVILGVQKPLVELMKTLAGGAHVLAVGDPIPGFDLHCPLLSLPLAFATRLDTIPAAVPYLAAPESKTKAWRDRLGAHEKLRVGLVWAGNPRKALPNASRIDAQRSIGFGRLAPLFEVTGCDFYSLQKGDDAVRQLRDSALSQKVINWTDELDDFSDTAGLVENLDLVISVDTSVLHLAGALGKPFWLLNRYNTCWRWLIDRDDNPWYPTARQFRQDATRDWAPVITRVRDALEQHVRSL